MFGLLEKCCGDAPALVVNVYSKPMRNYSSFTDIKPGLRIFCILIGS
jgi:hypothetical protein